MNISFLMFLNCASIGIITGLISNLTYILKKIFKNNYIINCVLDFCVYFLGVTFVFLVSNNINNNIFAFYEVLGFVLGVGIENFSCAKMFAKFFDMLYNKCAKAKNKIKNTKLGVRVFK